MIRQFRIMKLKKMLDDLSNSTMVLERENNNLVLVKYDDKIKAIYKYVKQLKNIENLDTMCLYIIANKITHTLQTVPSSKKNLYMVEFLLDVSNKCNQLIIFRLNQLLYEAYNLVEYATILKRNNRYNEINYAGIRRIKEELNFYTTQFKVNQEINLSIQQTILQLDSLLEKPKKFQRVK